MFLIGVFMSLAGYFKGRLDALVDEEIKDLEWDKKYDLTKSGETKHWWYFGLYTPKFPEKFPFSTTVLVFLTDKWHRTQFYMLRSFYFALSIAISNDIFTILIFTFIIFPVLVGVFFESSYQKYRKKLKKQYKTKSISSYTPQSDEPNEEEQITSIPEKQITDELH
jgi:hypothetical protein